MSIFDIGHQVSASWLSGLKEGSHRTLCQFQIHGQLTLNQPGDNSGRCPAAQDLLVAMGEVTAHALMPNLYAPTARPFAQQVARALTICAVP